MGTFKRGPRALGCGHIMVDETCTCGCPRSQHADRFGPGHGACETCTSCQQFTWKAFEALPGQERKP